MGIRDPCFSFSTLKWLLKFIHEWYQKELWNEYIRQQRLKEQKSWWHQRLLKKHSSKVIKENCPWEGRGGGAERAPQTHSEIYRWRLQISEIISSVSARLPWETRRPVSLSLQSSASLSSHFNKTWLSFIIWTAQQVIFPGTSWFLPTSASLQHVL